MLIVISLLFYACNENEKKSKAREILKEWVGKQIRFPNDIQAKVINCDSTGFNPHDAEYKVLLYTDSAGCTGCRLQLHHWIYLRNDAQKAFGNKLGFLFYLQPKSVNELDDILMNSAFEYPVFYDLNGELNKMNTFPEEHSYQCFLLDKNNKVLMVGNPVDNPAIWDLYKQEIAPTGKDEKKLLTTVELNNKIHNFAGIDINDKPTANFIIKNTGDNILIINDVIGSCGCTTAEWQKQPVASGESTTIKLTYTPDKTGYFDKQVDIFCNVENNVIRVSITGTVK